MNQVIVKVNDNNINATHFAGMTKAEAIKMLKADGIEKDAAEAGKIWSAARKAVTDATGKSDEDQEKDAQKLEELNRSRAATGVESVADAETLKTTLEPPKGADVKSK